MTSRITIRTSREQQRHVPCPPDLHVELTSDLLDDDRLLDDLLAFAIDTVGARVLEVRVLEVRPLRCWHGPSG